MEGRYFWMEDRTQPISVGTMRCNYVKEALWWSGLSLKTLMVEKKQVCYHWKSSESIWGSCRKYFPSWPYRSMDTGYLIAKFPTCFKTHLSLEASQHRVLCPWQSPVLAVSVVITWCWRTLWYWACTSQETAHTTCPAPLPPMNVHHGAPTAWRRRRGLALFYIHKNIWFE